MDATVVLIVGLIGLLVIGLPVAAMIVSAIALSRSSRITELESRVSELESLRLSAGIATPGLSAATATEPIEAILYEAEVTDAIPPIVHPSTKPQAKREAIQWEMLIGQKAMGWVAVLLAIFAAAFFLRYAYENNWIGPQGRVAIGEAIGVGFVLAGFSYYRRGWRLFSQMLSACGIVVLYLSTYSAFGFYRLLPQVQAGGFLAVIVALSLISAVLYNSSAIAFVSVVGGFLSPILLASEHDSYQSLFIYLAALNMGVALVGLARGWPGLGSLALVFTQSLFWAWYAEHYHPEKLSWAFGFQAVIYLLYVVQDVGIQFHRFAGSRWEGSSRMVAAAACWFAAVFILLRPDYRPWMGTAAVGMSVVYAAIAGRLLRFQGRYTFELLTAVALAVSFIALAIPLEAHARWISLGWAACGASLLWLSVRVRASSLLWLAGILSAMSLGRVLFVDLGAYSTDEVMPILNSVGLPSLAVNGVLLLAIVASIPYRDKVASLSRTLLAAIGLLVLLGLWIVLSVDLYHYFDVQARLAVDTSVDWRRMGQMSLSVLWTLYASALLMVGFRWRTASLRWMAFLFFGVTIIKVLVLDMAGLMQLYRIVAFLVLAVFLGLAARVYQRQARQSGLGANGETQTDATS